MQQFASRSLFYVTSLIACAMMALSTGCASGGFKLTRQYAGFVNKQNIIIRIILYLLTSVVFAITMVADLVIFNTMDFWSGTVAAGSYEFQKDGKTFQVHHEIQPDSLKRSTIEILGQNKALLQTVVLKETTSGEIELTVDGQLRAKVRDIHSLPTASIFDTKGSLLETKMVLLDAPVGVAAH